MGEVRWWRASKGALPGGLAVVLAVSACEEVSVAVPTAAVSDSAGVEIVSYDLMDVDVPSWLETGEIDLQIGVVDGPAEYAFSSIGDVAVVGDGSLVVTDRQTLEVRVFDSSVEHLRSLGGEGGGPGEFSSSPWIAGVSGDSVFTFDSRAARVTTFALSGEVLGDVSVRSEMVGRPLVALRQSDGSFLTRSRWVNPEVDMGFHELQLFLDSIVIARLAADGSFVDTVSVEPDAPRGRSILGSMTEGIRVNQAVPPFSPEGRLQTYDAQAVFAYGDRFDVAFHGADGVERRLRVSGVRHPATRAELQEQQESILNEDLGSDGVTPEMRRLFLDFIPEVPPEFDDIRVSTTGDLWVSLFDPDPASDTRWLVFDPEGGLRGAVETPAGLSVRWIGPSAIVGVATDDFDVQYVRRYPLVEPTPDG